MRTTGVLTHRNGVETGKRAVLEISSINLAKADTAAAHRSKVTLNVTATGRRLENLGSRNLVEGSQATLAFPETGKVAGNSSCNHFVGPAGCWRPCSNSEIQEEPAINLIGKLAKVCLALQGSVPGIWRVWNDPGSPPWTETMKTQKKRMR